jgi:hypothetical protein
MPLMSKNNGALIENAFGSEFDVCQKRGILIMLLIPGRFFCDDKGMNSYELVQKPYVGSKVSSTIRNVWKICRDIGSKLCDGHRY